MKTKIYSILFFALTLSCAITLSCCSRSNDNHCPSTNQKIPLGYKDSYVPYQGNEHLKFLHNNTDTQIFIAQAKETYYTTEGASQQGECAKDYEDVKLKFVNQTTNDVFNLVYERDQVTFPITPSPGYLDNDYTFYKLSYKNKTYNTQLYFSGNTPIYIDNVGYGGVIYIGNDTTSNYVAYKVGKGILRIRVNNENWDLIL
jgi:hypothetical protein